MPNHRNRELRVEELFAWMLENKRVPSCTKYKDEIEHTLFYVWRELRAESNRERYWRLWVRFEKEVLPHLSEKLRAQQVRGEVPRGPYRKTMPDKIAALVAQAANEGVDGDTLRRLQYLHSKGRLTEAQAEVVRGAKVLLR